MRKLIILLFLGSLLSVNAQISWSNGGKYERFFFYEGNFLVEHNTKSRQLSVVTQDLQTHPVQQPDFGNFMLNNVVNLDENSLGLLFNDKKSIRLYYFDKNSYIIRDDYVIIGNVSSSLIIENRDDCKLFYSPDSNYLYLQCRCKEWRVEFSKFTDKDFVNQRAYLTNDMESRKNSGLKHIVLDRQLNVLWSKENLKLPVVDWGIGFSAINNEGRIFLTFTGIPRAGFSTPTYYNFLVYFDEKTPVTSLQISENEMFSVPILAIDNRNVLLAGMVEKSGSDDSYFASWLIDTEAGEVKEGTMEKLNLKERENYLGDDDPMISPLVAYAVYKYFIMPDYYILFKKFDGMGNEANGVIMDINKNGTVENYSFLNNCQCDGGLWSPLCAGIATEKQQLELHFVYEDNIKNLRSGNTELYETDSDEPKEHCFTYAKYNTKTKEFEKRKLFTYGEENIRDITDKYIYGNVFYFTATLGKNKKITQVGKIEL